MMNQSIFISHSGADTNQANKIDSFLSQKGMNVLVDRNEIHSGDSFIRFMEEGLNRSDYCLLLWSMNAAQSPWVQVEWEAALYKSVTESRRFLVVGRLESIDTPQLLSPRLRIDLFPGVESGLSLLMEMIRADMNAAQKSAKPVRQPRVPLQKDPSWQPIYLSNELFGITIPMEVDLTIPTGLHLNRIKHDLQLPDQQDIRMKVGVRWTYRLVHNGASLDNTKSLEFQNVKPNDVIVLEVEMAPFAANAPHEGSVPRQTFRGEMKKKPGENPLEDAEKLSEGHFLLRKAIKQAGLGA